MDRLSWKDKKERVCLLIKSISDHYGGDNIDWLREYCRDVLEADKPTLYRALFCFEDVLLISGAAKPEPLRSRQIKKSTCQFCGYMPAFCFCAN